MIFYFSGTGNSAWVAQQLAQQLNDRLCFIPDELSGEANYKLRTNEKLGFVFPVYAWRVPKFILRFIKKMKVENVSYVYFVATCGDDSGRMDHYFKRAAKRKGWKVACGFSVIMPEAYVSLPGFDVDDKIKENRKLRQAKTRIDDIATFIADSRQGRFETIPGRFPWAKSLVLGWGFNTFLMSHKPFHTNSNCIGCGKCAMVCPLHNIEMKSSSKSPNHSEFKDKPSRPYWHKNCVGCLRCYHACPQRAIEYGRFTQGKGQYLHPEKLLDNNNI